MHWLCLDLAGRMLKAKCIMLMLKLKKSNELVKLFNCIKIFREVKTAVSWNEFQNYFIIVIWMKQHLLKFVIHNCVTQGKSTLRVSQNTSGGYCGQFSEKNQHKDQQHWRRQIECSDLLESENQSRKHQTPLHKLKAMIWILSLLISQKLP